MQGSNNKGADLRQGKDHYTSHSLAWVQSVKRQARKALRRISAQLLRQDPDDTGRPIYGCGWWS